MPDPTEEIEGRLGAPGPKRILALDGGGVRGILAVGVLAAVETRLARLSGRASFRLCDYFDLIGGASTGSIVAAALAIGKSAAEIADLYRRLAPDVFAPRGRHAGIRTPRFDADRLEAVLVQELGDHELADPAVRTGLAIFAKRADTGATWTVTNTPRSAHWNGGGDAAPNRHFLIRQLVQASIAAPTVFEERKITLNDALPGSDREGFFVDAAIAGLNNPSLQLLQVATLKGYGFEWLTGPDQILMLSVGAGHWRPRLDEGDVVGAASSEIATAAARAVAALNAMIHDTSQMAIATLQGLSNTPRPWRINGEIGDMRGATLSPVPLLHFQRMDAVLDKTALEELGLRYGDHELHLMRELASDDAATLARLHEIGLRTGERYFLPAAEAPKRNWEREMFPRRFDPPFFSGRPAGPPKSKLEALGRAWDEGV